MKTKITSIFTLALLITACSNGDDVDNIEPGGEVKSEIVLGTTVSTRASVESDDNGSITIPTSLGVAFLRAENAASANWTTATNSNQTEIGVGPGIINATLTPIVGGNKIDFVNKQYYHGNSGIKSFLKGYYPTTATMDKGGDGVVTATWKINGATDLLASDYFEGDKTKDGETNSLIFKHLLSKITIKVIAENDAAIAGWGAVDTVKIMDQSTEIAHKFDGNSSTAYKADPASVSTDSITIHKVNGTVGDYKEITDAFADRLTLTKDTVLFGQAMVYPAKTYSIKVRTTNGGDPVTLNATIDGSGAQAGMNHVITLLFRTGEITPTIKVLKWEDSSDSASVVVE